MSLKQSLDALANAALSLEHELQQSTPDEARVKILRKEVSTHMKTVKEAVAHLKDDDAKGQDPHVRPSDPTAPNTPVQAPLTKPNETK